MCPNIGGGGGCAMCDVQVFGMAALRWGGEALGPFILEVLLVKVRSYYSTNKKS